jgi:hypothetical protein
MLPAPAVHDLLTQAFRHFSSSLGVRAAHLQLLFKAGRKQREMKKKKQKKKRCAKRPAAVVEYAPRNEVWKRVRVFEKAS